MSQRVYEKAFKCNKENIDEIVRQKDKNIAQAKIFGLCIGPNGFKTTMNEMARTTDVSLKESCTPSFDSGLVQRYKHALCGF